jgi:MraZ protein
MEEVSKLNKNNPDVRRLVRLLFNGTHYDRMDSQFRIIIPQKLKLHARIESEILVTGTDDRIELWNPAMYDEWEKSSGKSLEMLLQEYLTN